MARYLKWTYALLGLLASGGCYDGTGSPARSEGAVNMVDQKTVEIMRGLDRLDERGRRELLSQVDRQRQELLAILLKYASPDSSKQVMASAIYLIGRHRLAEGAPALVKHIDFDGSEPPRRGPEPLWERYPAVEALITLGHPSVSPVLDLLRDEKGELRRDLAVKVLRYAEDADIAKRILERAAGAEKDPNRKSNLQDALARLDRLPR